MGDPKCGTCPSAPVLFYLLMVTMYGRNMQPKMENELWSLCGLYLLVVPEYVDAVSLLRKSLSLKPVGKANFVINSYKIW